MQCEIRIIKTTQGVHETYRAEAYLPNNIFMKLLTGKESSWKDISYGRNGDYPFTHLKDIKIFVAKWKIEQRPYTEEIIKL